MEKLLAEKACAYFEEGFNCSESMLRAYLDCYGKDIALSSAASGFGGGIGGRGFTRSEGTRLNSSHLCISSAVFWV